MADEKKMKSVEETPKSSAKKTDKKSDKKDASKKKENIFKRMGKRISKFFKDVKGECKKIVWPDKKTVLKSTWVVIVIVIIFCLALWLVDTGLSSGVKGLINLAEKVGSNKDAAKAAGMIVSGLIGF